MNDLISALAGIGGVLVGAGVGFYSVHWQHKAQSLQEVRSKCAELMFLGDQSANARDTMPEVHGEELRTEYKIRVPAMETILRYLELSAPDRIYQSAKNFMASTDKVGLSYQGGASPGQALDEFNQARESLVMELRK